MKNVLAVFNKVFVLSLIAINWSGNLFAMAAPAGKEGGAVGGLGMFMPMILVFVIFYFLLIRPQSKQQKKHREMVAALQRGDLVVTNSGIYGKITAVTETVVTLEIAENVRIKIDKSQVAKKQQQDIPPSKDVSPKK